MRTIADVEAYLERLKRPYRSVDGESGTILIQSDPNLPPIGLRVDAPIVVLRVHMGNTRSEGDVALFRYLLQLNAKALVHTSFGLEDNRIVLSSALALENLDLNEIEATLDEIDMTLVQQFPILSKMMASQG